MLFGIKNHTVLRDGTDTEVIMFIISQSTRFYLSVITFVVWISKFDKISENLESNRRENRRPSFNIIK